ncbi:fibronectin type III domain-containing protein [Micromonospora krabiensis]|uniref:Fibronectin type III domain-containing protein n=1 Tax=Micromonospora krabiensis TaxID=307121 RepID=A0A1C3NEB3_9ACTN|nr:fibronectin type III domain-containing protein [Micromonospora krabiensis]SBV30923.1 Fibronectin type III domain-containing protein [Micromonospora krabiensis]
MATIDDAVSTGPDNPRPRSRRLRGGLVTIGTVAALLAAMGLTVLGLGAADNAVASYDASSWLWSAARSELARVNGVTARVDTRTEVPGARRHPMQVTQTDRLLVLRDLNTGQVSSLDLATLQITATTRTTPGLGVNVALHEDAAFVVDAVQGVVRQLDPRSLSPVGEPIRYPPGITGGSFDGTGRLWIAVPSEGTVSAITAGALPAKPASPGAAGGLSPKQVETYDVAEPSHELVVSTLDDGVAVLDRTAGALVTVQQGTVRPTKLTMASPGALPARTSGPKVPVTLPGERRVLVVGEAGGEERAFAVPGTGDRLSPAVAWAGRFYCADEATGTLYAFDADGKLVDTVKGKATGPLELEVRENHLFINAPDSSTARVVDDKHQVREVNKYANDVLGGDPPPVAPPPPPPKKPRVGKPSAPRSVTAAAGNAQARVSWRPATANGAEITKYVVEGAGQKREVGANQRAVEITGLTNGETYRFSVHAVNAKGAGPSRTSNPVTPTAAVPDPPASVTAQERPDGTVLVRWPAANGQGNTIAKYAVTATSAGTNAPVGESTKTELVVPAGELEYGTQYAFTVVSVNDKGAGSAASPVSNTVVPFAAPGRPGELRASTVANQPGTVSVQWAPAEPNGRPVTTYQVEVGGRTSEVTDTRTTLTGLGNGQNVTVKVKAVNEAGAGPEATATARTVAEPRVTVTGSSATATAATVTFTVDAGGGQATCTLTTPGEPAKSGACSSITMSGLTPGTAYTFTVTASNAAGKGSVTRPQSTDALYGIATCHNGAEGETATYCDKDVSGRNGNEIFSVTRQDNNRQVGWAKPGTRLKAYCKKSGEEVYAYIYNNDKRSTWWVQVDYEGKNYIPWAWLNLEGGDNINVLPTC